MWLDAELTSPYRFYQFWLSTSDDDVVRYLKYFTFLTAGEIAQLEAAHEAEPQKREGHRRLAREVTTLVHGEDACARAIQSSRVLFGAEISDLTASDLLDIFNGRAVEPADFRQAGGGRYAPGRIDDRERLGIVQGCRPSSDSRWWGLRQQPANHGRAPPGAGARVARRPSIDFAQGSEKIPRGDGRGEIGAWGN